MIYKQDNIDMSLVQCPYEEEKGYIYIADDYTNNILKLSGYDEISDDDFKFMCFYKALVEYLSEYALKSASNAYNYAQYWRCSAFPLGEEIIATDADFSYEYAIDVLKGRFELGETTISTNAYYSYHYAKYILKGRFELGEQIIATNTHYSFLYARDVLKGRFELGESAIAAEPLYNQEYKQFIGIAL